MDGDDQLNNNVAPPPFHHRSSSHTNNDHHSSIPIPYTMILIVAPIAIVGLLVVVLSILLIVQRFRPRNNDDDFGKNSVADEKQMSAKCSTTTTGSVVNYSSNADEKSCIAGGKLPVSGNTRYKGGNVFTYKELELATNGFSGANVIGSGGFGTVFRGTLPGGTTAAIKVLHSEGTQREREFRVEVDLLSRLQSRYLVGLLGYCADQHHRLLVFEFMPNGSLQQHLHPTSSNHPRQPLDWWTRLRIALDCARGLEFLHEHCTPAVIHRDFKCSNILLDRNYRAKVSDFGMAKMGSDKINGQVLTRVLGTSGYVAPEYASTGRLTTKSDVYSYGVVLLELITGRSPVDTRRPNGEHVLVKYALPRLTNREKVEEMVDPILHGQYSKKELIQIAAIAAVCVQPEADYRPLMTDIVQSLIPLVKNPASSFPNTPSRSLHPQSSSTTTTLQQSEHHSCMC